MQPQSLTEDEAIDLLQELNLLTDAELMAMEIYLGKDLAMPPSLENKLQLILFLQAGPPTDSLH
jgi:hypothetical protein